jgi:hypothetical protein
MKKLKLTKDNEVNFVKESSIYCDFCGDKDKTVFTSSFDEGEDSRKCLTQICEDCVRQLAKHL